MMAPAFAWRMVRETDPRLLWKISYNFGYKGMRSVQRFKKRLKRGEHFPPFLYLSIRYFFFCAAFGSEST